MMHRQGIFTMTSNISTARIAVFDRFLKDERGTVLSEFVIIFPILIWAWIGMYYYWDIYRAQNKVQKASFTVADNISRSNGELRSADIDGLQKFLAYLSDTRQPVEMRVSSIKWNPATNKHEVSWSYSPGGKMAELKNADMAKYANRLPTLMEFETVTLLETSVDYRPPLGATKIGPLELGVGDREMQELIVTRPRFVSKICLVGRTCT
jgi:hypothetical protein